MRQGIIITFGEDLLDLDLRNNSQDLVVMSMPMDLVRAEMLGKKKTISIFTFKIPLDGEYNLTSPTTIRQQMCLPTLLLASLMMAVMDRACVIRNSGGKLLIAIDLILPPTLKILKCN